MRNDEQLINDEVEATTSALADTSRALYDAVGPSAVLDWGYRIGLKFTMCIPCEMTTPTIGNICAVCWTQLEGTMKDAGITIKGTGSVGPTTTCPRCGTTFGTEYFLREHTVCHADIKPKFTGVATLNVEPKEGT